MKSVAGWYPVALSDGLDRGMSNGTHLFGRELVVWRDGDGAAHVWEDRCPHRGTRLSFGFVRENRLACLYHGWTYDTAGQCRYIPAHPQLTPPASIKAEVYPTGEAAGMVWVYSEISARPPAMPEDRPITPVRSLHVDCAPEAALAHLSVVELQPHHDAPRAPTRFNVIEPALLSIAHGRHELIVGLQPIAADRTALHIAITADAGYASADQRHYSAWAENLRRTLELPHDAGLPEDGA